MNYDALERELNTSLRSIYLLYGEEQYLIDMALKKIKKKFGELLLGINYVIIDETNLNDLISNIEMPAFGYDKKLIIVKNSGLFKKDGRKKSATPFQEQIGNYISDNLSIINDGVVLVFIENEVDKNSVYDIVERVGIICQIDLLKPYQIVNKLKKICSLYKVAVDDTTLNYLIEISGTNLQDLINEIRKLIEYAGQDGTITKSDIDKLSIKQVQAIIFDLTDNLGSKQISKAMEILDNLVYNKEPYQKILITLYNHFKRLYLLKLYEKYKMSSDISEILGLKANQTFLITKYKKQVMYFSEKELENIVKELIELDYKTKNGLIDIEIGLKAILCKN